MVYLAAMSSRRLLAGIASCAMASCSTIEIAADVRCRRGDEECLLRVWVNPDWSASYWGQYVLFGDVLVPIVDWGVSGYWTVQDWKDDHVRSRFGPVLAPVGWLAAIVLPCVSSHREPIDLDRALFGMRFDELAATRVEVLQLAPHATARDAEAELVRRLARNAEGQAVARSRLVEVEWVLPR